jgi:hypothetical protein
MFLRTRQGVMVFAIAAISIVGSSGAAFSAPSGSADKPTEKVESRHGGHAFGWQTPSVNSSHAEIASSSNGDSESSIITLKNSKAPTDYAFQMNLPPGGHLVPTADGGYDLAIAIKGQDLVAGHIDTPWAKDAKGKTLPTSFSLSGGVLTQHVTTSGATFPVTADPHYTWGWVTGTVYLNRQETNQLIFGAAITAIVAAGFGGWGALPPGGMAAYANYVFNQNHCVKIKLVPIGALFLYYPGEYWGSQGDGYCR